MSTDWAAVSVERTISPIANAQFLVREIDAHHIVGRNDDDWNFPLQSPVDPVEIMDARGKMNIISRSHEEIELRAYQCWEARGRPLGTPDTDWFNAEHEVATIEPDPVLSKIAREVGSALGNVVAFFSESDSANAEEDLNDRPNSLHKAITE